MKNMYVIVSNGAAFADRLVELDITEEDFLNLPTLEQEQLVKDGALEYVDIWVEDTKSTVEVVVSLGLVGCDAHIETDYTPDQWAKLYPEEREEHIIEKAWECLDYFHVAAETEKELYNTYRGLH